MLAQAPITSDQWFDLLLDLTEAQAAEYRAMPAPALRAMRRAELARIRETQDADARSA